MNDELKQIVDDCKSDLDKIEEWINSNPIHINGKYLVAYSIIRASGTIEVLYKRIVFDFLSDSVREETKNYLEKQILDSSSNPNTGNMLRVLDQFDGKRKEKFYSLIKDSTEKGYLSSLVNLRNDIAHGRACNSSINDVKKYFDGGLRILNSLEKVLK